ncbi:MAG: aldo/keto reductase [Parvibaculaceae bacterium]|nr:aldo/keto reductase [Parvibaculaceae bacterium]
MSVRVPSLGLGCAPLGNLYRAFSDAEADVLLEAAWANGVRYFDTAPLYGFGLSESRLGKFLATKSRSDYLVSTKVGRRLIDNEEWHPQREFFIDAAPFEPVFDYSYDGVMASVEESLSRLQLTSIDCLLLHDIGAATHGEAHTRIFREAMSGGLQAMLELRAKGIVKAIGVGVNEWQVCDEVMSHADWDYFLLAGRYTLLEQEPLNGFFDRCQARGIKVIIGGAFNSGILATGVCAQAKYDYGEVPSLLRDQVQAIEEICRQYKVPLPAAALQFPLAHPDVAAVVVGLSSPTEIEECLKNIQTVITPHFWEDLKNDGLLPHSAPTPMGALS